MITEELKNKFCIDVVKEANKSGSGYIDTVVDMAEKYEITVEIAAKLLSKPIIEKIQSEGEEVNLLPKISKLPF